jgi:hypothetical protein
LKGRGNATSPKRLKKSQKIIPVATDSEEELDYLAPKSNKEAKR